MTKEQIRKHRQEGRPLTQDVREYDAVRRVEYSLEKLEDACQRLGKHLLRVADNLREHGTKASFNNLGEVQGSGSEIDRLCGELRMAIDVAAEYLPQEKER